VFVPGSTAHDRFQLWVKAGVFLMLWQAGLLEYDRLKGIDWQGLSMDGAMTKAPLGGEKDRAQPHGPGQIGHETPPPRRRQRRAGRPGGGRGQPRGAGPGAAPAGPRRQHLCLDKGYDYAEVDALMEEFGFTAHIARRGEEPKAIKTSARKKARRWVVERAQSWMNRFRGVLIRWNKKAENDIAMLHFALAIIAYRASGLFG
jgi:transposase